VRTNAWAWVAAAALGIGAAAPALAEEGARCTWQESSRIRILIHDLGSEDLATRQAAERSLRAYGPKAHIALREASTHENPDVRLRASQILRTDVADPRGGGWVVWHEGLRVEMMPDRVRVLGPDGRLFEGRSIEDLQRRHPQIAARLRTLRVERIDARAGVGFDDRRTADAGFDRDDRFRDDRFRDDRFSGAGADERDRMDPAFDGHREDGLGRHDDADRMRSGQGFDDERYGSSQGRREPSDSRDDRTGAGRTAGDPYRTGTGATTGTGDRSGAGTTTSPGDRYDAGAGTSDDTSDDRMGDTRSGDASDRMGSSASAQVGPFGLQVRDLDDATRREHDLMGKQGVYVVTVKSQSKAANLGIQSGDLVTTVNGQTVRSSRELQTRLRDLGDDDLTVVVVRNGETKTLNVR
jgi:hypothetical protein